MPRRRVVPRAFYAGDPRHVAPALLGKLLVGRDGRVGRITDVEAYCGAEDPGSHAYRGRTARNTTMFGPPGHLYVYLIYGMHCCANVVCWPEGQAGAVLLRGVVPLVGIDAMGAARQGATGRPAPRSRLSDGPGKLCQAFGIDRGDDGADLVLGDRGIRVMEDGSAPPRPAVSTRIGLSRGDDLPWRWSVPT